MPRLKGGRLQIVLKRLTIVKSILRFFQNESRKLLAAHCRVTVVYELKNILTRWYCLHARIKFLVTLVF